MLGMLTQQAIKAVPSSQIILPTALGADPTSQPKPRHQSRVPRDRRRQLASEDPLSVYTLAPAGPPSSQTHPFTSQLLSSAQIEREAVSWLLLQGWEGYDSLMNFGAKLQSGECASFKLMSIMNCEISLMHIVHAFFRLALSLAPCSSCEHAQLAYQFGLSQAREGHS